MTANRFSRVLLSRITEGNFYLDKFSFTRADRILHRANFNYLSKFGNKIQDRYFIVLFSPGQAERTRLGITVSRKVGDAAKRNRIKRLFREYFRLNRNQLEGYWDINIIAKKAAADLTSEQVFSKLKGIFENICRRNCH